MSVVSLGLVAPRGLCLLDVDDIAPSGAFPRETLALRALIDTGAEESVLVARLADRLRLPVEGVKQIVDPFGRVTPCLTAAAEIVFHDGRAHSRKRILTITTKLLVASGEFQGGYELSLGADVLREFELRVNYHEGWLSLSSA